MPSIKTSVVVDVDDVPVSSFPVIRRLEPPEAQSFVVQRATGGGFVALPSGELTTIQTLVLQADQTVSIRLDGAAGAITLNPNAILVIMDGNLTAAPTVSNASGATATLRGLVAGS